MCRSIAVQNIPIYWFTYLENVYEFIYDFVIFVSFCISLLPCHGTLVYKKDVPATTYTPGYSTYLFLFIKVPKSDKIELDSFRSICTEKHLSMLEFLNQFRNRNQTNIISQLSPEVPITSYFFNSIKSDLYLYYLSITESSKTR